VTFPFKTRNAFLECLAVDVAGDDMGAKTGEQLGRGGAEAARRTGDNRHPPRQAEIGAQLI